MDVAFEYTTVSWSEDAGEGDLVDLLNTLGAEGWEAVGMVARGEPVLMPGMGADAIPEVVVLMKRLVSERAD